MRPCWVVWPAGNALAFSSTLHSLPFALVGKDNSTHLQDVLETLASSQSILLEPFNCEFLNAALYLLPATTEGDNLGVLVESGVRVW